MTTPSTSLTNAPHGGHGRRLALELGVDPDTILDLSASLNPFAPDATAILRNVLDDDPRAVGSYPDPATATTALADALNVDADRLVLTNGGAEAIALVAAIERRGAVSDPDFSLYRRHLQEVSADAPRWRSNPSSPLGQLADPSDQAHVWDEAFFPLATARWSRGDEASWRLGSLTKLWACPGLRLGYVIAPDVADAVKVRDRQPRWSVNALALAAIPRLLAVTDLPGWHRSIEELRNQFTGDLRALSFVVRDTTVNWVLVEHASDLRMELARHGVVVRDCDSFGMPGTYRVALPAPADLSRVVDAFSAVARGR